MLLPQLRDAVCRLHAELPKNQLVAWTSGNISARDPATGLVVIKPSGVRFEDLTPESMVVTDIHGRVVAGNLAPSSDTASHCYIYRHMPAVNGVVHTHSRYATAFAVIGEPIPCVTTAMADEFGGEIPCCGFCLIGGEEIGKLVVDKLTGHRSPAALLAESRCLHHRRDRRGGGQSGDHDRGQRRHRLDGAAVGRGHPDRAIRDRQPARPLSECVWTAVTGRIVDTRAAKPPPTQNALCLVGSASPIPI